jgi:hypothetical protein
VGRSMEAGRGGIAIEGGKQRGPWERGTDEEENEAGGGSGLGFYPALRGTGSGRTAGIDAGCAPRSNDSR